MTAARPRVKEPATLNLAEVVAVEPRLTSKVVEKGVKAPEFCCQKLESPAQLFREVQTVAEVPGKVKVVPSVPLKAKELLAVKVLPLAMVKVPVVLVTVKPL